MNLEKDKQEPSTLADYVPLRILDCRDLNGFRQFLIEWSDSENRSSWLPENEALQFKELFREFQFHSSKTFEDTMDVEIVGKMVQQHEIVYPTNSTLKGIISEQVSHLKKERMRFSLENYQFLETEEIRLIVQRFVGKIRKAISGLKKMTNKNMYYAILTIESLYEAQDEFGLIVQLNGSEYHSFISYKDMKDNHSYELQIFLESYLQAFFAQLTINPHLQGDYAAQAQFLGKIFDDSWRREASGVMVKHPCQSMRSMFAVEFDLNEYFNQLGGGIKEGDYLNYQNK